MQNFEVVFFKKENGSCPVEKFLNSLDVKMRAKLLRTISLLEKNGSQLREPYSKSLGDGIFEIRTKQGNDITRVLYFFFLGKKIILTNGFVTVSYTHLSRPHKAHRYICLYLLDW